ncbi:MAG: hypothetical protein ACFFCS_01130 [Candidatus Hodarchaeota archaeon]
MNYIELIPLQQNVPLKSRFLKTSLSKQFKSKEIKPKETVESLGYSFLVNKVACIPEDISLGGSKIVFVNSYKKY